MGTFYIDFFFGVRVIMFGFCFDFDLFVIILFGGRGVGELSLILICPFVFPLIENPDMCHFISPS